MSVREIKERLEAQLRYAESLDNGYLTVDCPDLRYLLARVESLEAALREIADADFLLGVQGGREIATRALAEKEGAQE